MPDFSIFDDIGYRADGTRYAARSSARATEPDGIFCPMPLAAACGLAGRLDEAREVVADAQAKPPGQYASIAVLEKREISNVPKFLGLQRRFIRAGLRKAGLPN